jgi:hypothetical protein
LTTDTIEQPQTLAEYKAERLSPPETKPEPEVIDVEAKEVKEEVVPEDDEPKVEDKPKKGKLAERFSELTGKVNSERAAREAAEARATAAEARAAEFEGKTKPAAPIDPATGPKPEPKNYTDAFEYAADLAAWSADTAVQAHKAAIAKAEEEAAKGQVLKAWQTRLEDAKTRIPDFEAKIASSSMQFSDIVKDTIIESAVGPDILAHFADDDAAVEKLNAMTVKQALLHIGRLEAKFEAALEKTEVVEEVKAEKPRVKLPAPITPVRASSASTDPIKSAGEFTGTYAEYKAARLKGMG